MYPSDPRGQPGVKLRSLGLFPVRALLDVHTARRWVRAFASELGFPRLAAEELTIVASEMGTNIVKYGVRGSLRVEELLDPRHGAAILLEARDEGPPFRDFALAMRDRSDDRGTIPPEKILGRAGIGAGLGAIKRLTHQLWVEPHSVGKSVIALRYLKRPPGI